MTNFTEQAEFAQTIPKLKRGSGFKGLEQRFNQLLQPLVNRTRFLSEQNTGGGLVYGGEWDATPSIDVVPLDDFYDILDNGGMVNGVFIPEPTGGAMICRYIDTISPITQILRLTWAATPEPSDTFLVGFFSPSTEIDIQAIVAGSDTGLVAVGSLSGTPTAYSKYGNVVLDTEAISNPVVAGDIVRIEFVVSTGTVAFINETEDTVIANFDLGNYLGFYENSLSFFVYSTVEVPITIDPENPLTQKVITPAALPSDREGKTYLVSAASPNSFFGEDLLHVGDFITFFSEGENNGAVISRLITESAIETIASEAANTAITTALESGGAIYNAIQSAVNP